MRKFLPVLAFAVAALLAAAKPVYADPVEGPGGGSGGGGNGSGSDPMYDWTLGGLPGVSGSGQLDAYSNGVISSFTGTIDANGQMFNVSMTSGPSNNFSFDSGTYSFSFDNTLFPKNSPDFLDLMGILMTADALGNQANLFDNGNGNYGFCYELSGVGWCSGADGQGDGLQFGLFEAPEPGTLALLGTGLVAAAGAVRRRRRKAKA